jgi:putative ABC transport system permease protein
MISGLLQDLRFALRTLRSTPGFAAVAILTLALGIGANTAIFSVVDSVLLRPLPFRDAPRLVWGWGNFPLNNSAAVSPADFADFRADSRSFEQFAAIGISDGDSNLAGGEKPEQVRSNFVSWNFFDALGVRPAWGRTFLPADEQTTQPQVVILGRKIWQRDFGSDPGVIGRAVTIDGQAETIVGVLPADIPSLSAADIWVPAPMLAPDMRVRRGHFLGAVGRLKQGVSLKEAQAELDGIAQKLAREYPQSNKGWSLRLVALRDAVVGPSVENSLVVLLAAVGVLLLIACANVAILLLARATTRRKEIAIRAALGSGRWRIARLMLAESTVLAALGGALGIFLSVWGVGALRLLAPADLPRLEEIRVNASVVLFAFGASAATTLIFGLAPALFLSRTSFEAALNESSRGSLPVDRHAASSVLVIGEVAMSLALLAGAGLLLKSFWRLSGVNPGFRAGDAATARLSINDAVYKTPASRAALVRKLEERIAALPGVQAAGAISELPLSGQYNDDFFKIAGRVYEPNQTDDADLRRVTPGYLSAMGIPLLQGRWVTPTDAADAPGVVVVNEPFVKRYFGGKDAIGKQILIEDEGTKPRTIVGVIGGVHHFALNSPQPPEMYTPLAQGGAGSVNFVVRGRTDLAFLAGAMCEAVGTIDRDEALSVLRPMNEVVAASIGQPRFSARLLASFALLALLLAAVGLYGTLAYAVDQRTREIGIRMAIGAQPREVLRMIVARGLRLAVTGTAIGLAGALAVSRLLRGMLFGVSATDPVTFVSVAAVMIVVAVAACWVPARRAMRVDPIVALRYE